MDHAMKQPPAWIAASLEFVERIGPSVYIRALRLSEQQWAEYEEFLQHTPRTLWSHPVERRSA